MDQPTKPPNDEVRAYLQRIGRNGGAAGKGKAKKRGNSEYYSRLARAAVKARTKKAGRQREEA